MYRVLLVDDELFAVKGMMSGVNWERLGISEVIEAYHAEEAKKSLLQLSIDLMLCDIEMPEENGLQLVEWVRAHKPEVTVIFLTCHAEFSFAQKAVQLGSYDYLLKPVIFSELENVVAKALEGIREKRESIESTEHLKKYRSLWENKKTALIERFWQDILSQRLLPSEKTFDSAMTDYQLPVELGRHILLVLVSVEQWSQPFNERDEEIMTFALRNAAEEMIVGSRAGHVVEDHRGNMVIFLYASADEASRLADETALACEAYIASCSRYLYATLSCYIGEVVRLQNMMESYHSLLDWEHRNVTRLGSVLVYGGSREGTEGASRAPVQLLHWADWFEKGDLATLTGLIDETLHELGRRQVSVEALEDLYHSFLQVVYYVLHRKGIDAQLLHREGALPGIAHATRSLGELGLWMRSMVVTVDGLLSAKRPTNSIVDKMKAYISENLHVDFSREDLAAHVFLNPAYISRLFRKETGHSLSDFVLQERMKLAADWLLETDQPVSQIAVHLGYGNFSHFARMFKRVYGVTPQEYRKK
ncbi:two-component system, response regulator YesN [Paenibacillus sp. UNCCL117]|uniref:helix-turn-helix domain-containing protein n=1 Tax=unclassified Paenibacillus TaxID=185978 RepID=UPI00088960FC|nr:MULTISPECIES: helix-turn-helix domain-containing protein [unclassified Paenibacillus]SDD58862.1 two-component system, response regulator YesN [Paenibacillus sp. cl123]SFW50928.1 two-component system, response regulator YesN [Paenibacillus sp. UNCCL117]